MSAEFGRPQRIETKESVLFEQYHKELSSHAFAIQKRFDKKIARRLGHEGSIFDTLKEYVETNENKRVREIEPVSAQFQDYVKIDYAINSFRGAQFTYPHDKLDSYEASFDLDGGGKIKLGTDNTELRFFFKDKMITSAQAEIGDFYNFGERNFPTERSIKFSTNPTDYGVLTIEQKKNDIAVTPLLYGNLDEFGNVSLFPDQGVYVSDGQPNILFEEDKNQLTVEAKNTKFYFPIVTNPHNELITIAKHLGV